MQQTTSGWVLQKPKDPPTRLTRLAQKEVDVALGGYLTELMKTTGFHQSYPKVANDYQQLSAAAEKILDLGKDHSSLP